MRTGLRSNAHFIENKSIFSTHELYQHPIKYSLPTPRMYPKLGAIPTPTGEEGESGEPDIELPNEYADEGQKPKEKRTVFHQKDRSLGPF